MATYSRLATSPQHFRATHARWTATPSPSSHRSEALADSRSPRCASCRHFVPLTAQFAYDWGACSNGRSPCDRMAVFEHHHCDHFSTAESPPLPTASETDPDPR